MILAWASPFKCCQVGVNNATDDHCVHSSIMRYVKSENADRKGILLRYTYILAM